MKAVRLTKDGDTTKSPHSEPATDQRKWGKVGHIPQAVEKAGDLPYSIKEQQGFIEAAKEAWPVIRLLLITFGFLVLIINAITWTVLKTPDRWTWVIMAAFLFFIAYEKGKLNKHFQFLIYGGIGLLTAFWI